MFTEDISLFFGTSGFAQTVKINGKQINGILDKEYIESGFSGSTKPIFVCASSDLTNVSEDSTLITADNVTYKVKGPIEPDGTGVTKLILELQ